MIFISEYADLKNSFYKNTTIDNYLQEFITKGIGIMFYLG